MSRRLLVSVVLFLAATGFAFSQDEAPRWGYVQAGYIDFDPDGGVSDDGGFAGVSVSILKNFHVFAEYDDIGDYTLWNGGVGWHGLFGEPGDLFAEVRWNNIDVDSTNVSDDGYQVDAGVRWQLVKWLEVKGQVNWVDYSDAGDDTTFLGEAVVLILNNKLGFGASFETGSDADTLRGFVRWNFGR
jgi:hypothetical protein